MDIALKNLQTKIPIRQRPTLLLIKKILRREAVRDAHLTVIFVTRQKIQVLNKKFLGRNYATDVLAFDLRGAQVKARRSKRRPTEIYGDIVISTDAAIQNAKLYNTTVIDELSLYIVHGILHLLGYDDHSPTDIAAMRSEEKRILKLVS